MALQALQSEANAIMVMAVDKSIAMQLLNVNHGPMDRSLWECIDGDMWFLPVSDMVAFYCSGAEANDVWSSFVALEDSDFVHEVVSIIIDRELPAEGIVEVGIEFVAAAVGGCGA